MKTTATKRHLVTEALALHLGYKVEGTTGLVDGVDIRNALAEVALNDIAPTRRVGLGAAAGVTGVATFGLLSAPLALLGLKRKDNRTVTIQLVGNDGAGPISAPRTFGGKQYAQAIKFAERVNEQK